MCALLQIYEASILCSVVLEPLNKMTRLFPEEGCVKSSAQGCFSACTVVSNGRHASGLSNRLMQKQKQVKTKKKQRKEMFPLRLNPYLRATVRRAGLRRMRRLSHVNRLKTCLIGGSSKININLDSPAFHSTLRVCVVIT